MHEGTDAVTSRDLSQDTALAHEAEMSTALEVERLGPWFHNLHLPDGTQTAPDHFLGDFPAFKWRQIAPQLPKDLSGWTALDIGCNAGFYSFELARRGARVTALDHDPHYLEQARWAARRFELADRIRFEQRTVYDLARMAGSYDLVLFLGVFYHLRYPLLGLDLVVACPPGFEPLAGILETAQKRIEGFNFDSRKQVLAYDDVLNTQRLAVYARRNLALTGTDEEFRAGIMEIISGDEHAMQGFETREAEFGPEYDALVELLSSEREFIKAQGRSTEGLAWQEALDRGLLDLLRADRLLKSASLTDRQVMEELLLRLHQRTARAA